MSGLFIILWSSYTSRIRPSSIRLLLYLTASESRPNPFLGRFQALACTSMQARDSKMKSYGALAISWIDWRSKYVWFITAVGILTDM